MNCLLKCPVSLSRHSLRLNIWQFLLSLLITKHEHNKIMHWNHGILSQFKEWIVWVTLFRIHTHWVRLSIVSDEMLKKKMRLSVLIRNISMWLETMAIISRPLNSIRSGKNVKFIRENTEKIVFVYSKHVRNIIQIDV